MGKNAKQLFLWLCSEKKCEHDQAIIFLCICAWRQKLSKPSEFRSFIKKSFRRRDIGLFMYGGMTMYRIARIGRWIKVLLGSNLEVGVCISIQVAKACEVKVNFSCEGLVHAFYRIHKPKELTQKLVFLPWSVQVIPILSDENSICQPLYFMLRQIDVARQSVTCEVK